MRIKLLALAGVLFVAQFARSSTNEGHDVVIYGATSSGVIAAVQAAKLGKSVVLIEPGQHLGGMTSGGLGFVDAGKTESIGGLTREFFNRVWKHYQQDSAWTWEKKRTDLRGQHRPLPPGDQTCWVPEPSVAERIFVQMLAEAKVAVVRGERLNRKGGVRKEGLRILSITTESGRTYAGKMFLDTTYEGDLMAAAGVSSFVGREANSRYGENMNGIRSMADRATKLQIDPYRIPGDSKSGLLPRVHPDLGGMDFEEDRGVQAYCYRMCLTDVPQNRVMVSRPADYDEIEYELVFRYLKAGGGKETFMTLSLLPNRKTDSNNAGPFSTDYIGMSWDWAEADYATREKIAQAHERWQRGLLWTLQNHPRVPPEVRAYFAPWGLAKDEFTDTKNWPHQIYVREARRMISDLVITENMANGTESQPTDAVGLGSYMFDSHAIKYYVDAASGFVTTDGGLGRPPWPRVPPHPYAISYRAIIPKKSECGNLLVPICLSATHVAYGSIRMEPVFMILGQSAATAAALAIDKGVVLHDLGYESLGKQLAKDGQVLSWSAVNRARSESTNLKNDLQVLLSHKVIGSIDYWLSHAVEGQSCDGARVSALLIQAANRFAPASSLDEAVSVLNTQRIINSKAYWLENAVKGKHCSGTHVAVVIQNIAPKLSVKK